MKTDAYTPSHGEILSCKSKIGFPTSTDALLDAASRNRNDVTSYRCKVCRYWHYTSKLK